MQILNIVQRLFKTKPLQNDIADVVGSKFVGTNEKRVLYFWYSVGSAF